MLISWMLSWEIHWNSSPQDEQLGDRLGHFDSKGIMTIISQGTHALTRAFFEVEVILDSGFSGPDTEQWRICLGGYPDPPPPAII